jgi:CheY-like chemotaxis protein
METTDCILVVDDEPEIRRLLRDYLSRNGFEAVMARDGREMWQALERHAVDLVVLDLMLPDTDGLTLCRDLRAKSNMPVIMLTARGEEVDRIVGIEMGADDYLVKPFNPSNCWPGSSPSCAARGHCRPTCSLSRRAASGLLTGVWIPQPAFSPHQMASPHRCRAANTVCCASCWITQTGW